VTATTGAQAPSTGALARSYLNAKRTVIDAGYAGELDWQQTRRVADVTDIEFVRQSAWVILSAGMRESVVHAVFPRLGTALHAFDPHAMCASPSARDDAMQVFAHERKVDAVLAIAGIAMRLGSDGLRHELARDALGFVSRLPYMGPATSRHLAKNLGVPAAKPDRHLLRITEATGRASADKLCEEIGSWLEEPVCVVDIVLWRWATVHGRKCANHTCDGLLHH
jgi:hypothetical protein